MDKDIQLITVSEAAKLLAVHRSTLYKLIIKDSDFPNVYNFNFGKRFNKDDVINYINSRKAA